MHVSTADYRALAEVRYGIRRFLAFSEDAARAAGVEPQQHQLLLAIRGLPAGHVADITTLAGRLQVRHHSAVELAKRARAAGLVSATADAADARRSVLRLTARGAAVLERLSRLHRGELAAAGADLTRALKVLTRVTRASSRG